MRRMTPSSGDLSAQHRRTPDYDLSRHFLSTNNLSQGYSIPGCDGNFSSWENAVMEVVSVNLTRQSCQILFDFNSVVFICVISDAQTNLPSALPGSFLFGPANPSERCSAIELMTPHPISDQ
jgi:hypothetical protein